MNTETIEEKPKNVHIDFHKVKVNTQLYEKLKERYIAFEVRTSGTSSVMDKIIDVGAVLYENGKLVNNMELIFIPVLKLIRML